MSGPGGRGPVTLRPMGLDDVSAAAEIEHEVDPDPWPAEQFSELLDLTVGFGWVGEDPPGRVVGYVLGWVVGDEAELANLVVAPDHHRRGIGARLMRRFLDDAAERGARKVYLEVRESNAAARSMYEGHGFRVVGRRKGYYRNPLEDALVMLGAPTAGDRG